MMLVIAFLATFAVYIYIKISKSLNYWKIRDVVHPEPKIIFGNCYENAMRREAFSHMIENLYKKYKHERYFGWYHFMTPILMINDLELIKKITIKDFDYFPDHPGFSREDIDPLWCKNLFAIKGEKWREMRSTLSPSFTTSKMKIMFSLVMECADRFANYFLDRDEDVVTVEMKDIFTRYSNDVIASCAFGVTCDSLQNQDNDFYLKGKETADFSGIKVFKFFLFKISPTLTKILKVKIIPTSCANFFRKIAKDSIRERKEKHIYRPDMINLLMEARKEEEPVDSSQKKLWISDDDIAAQALIFFFAGFDTTSSLMYCIAYEMAVNKDIQDKLRSEILETLEEFQGQLNYDTLMKMKYLDMVVLETLRKWPPSPTTDRLCVKEYRIPAERPGEKDLVIEKGTTLWLPIQGIQRNEEFYPDPEKFDPERFTSENKSNMNPSTFLSFGYGPRNCIGSRFALMENKIIIFNILRYFEIVPVEKTVIPMVISKKHINLQAEGGLWLGLKRIKSSNK